MRVKKHVKKFFFVNEFSTIIIVIGVLIIIVILHLEINSVKQASVQKPLKIVWAAFNGGGSSSGINNFETAISINDVSSLKRLWQIALPYKTNGTPVEVPNVNTASGIKDLLFITTQKGSLVVLDAATGVKIWEADTNGNFVGNQGTSSSPAVDPSNQFIYSYGIDGKVHKYAIGTGTEDISKGFPVIITKSTDVEKESAPLNIGNGYLYVPTSAYGGDFGAYVGHVVAINLATGSITIFNSLCSNIKVLSPAGFCPQSGSGIWSRAGAVVDPVTNNVFVVTGNGNYNASSGGTNYGDSVIELTPDLSGIVDSFTPSNYNSLASGDEDLGSSGVALLPRQNNTNTPYLVVVGGKDKKVRLLNKQNLSGAGGPNHIAGELQSLNVNCEIFAHPIAWNDSSNTTWVFIADTCANLYAYKVINNGTISTLQQIYQKSGLAKNSPFMANNLLFTPTSNKISAVDPTTGNILWSSDQTSSGGNIGSLHWQSPLVVNGGVYMPDENGNLFAYGLTGATQPPATVNTSTPVPTNSTSNITFYLTVCPHGLGNCGDNVNALASGNTNPVHSTRTVTLTVLSSSNQIVATSTGTVTYKSATNNFKGIINTSSVQNGQYLVELKLPGFLSKQLPGIITISQGQTTILPSVSLVTGDINNDDQLDIQDYNVLISCFGSKFTTSQCLSPATTQNSGADLDDNGDVNGTDYNLFLRELSVQKGK